LSAHIKTAIRGFENEEQFFIQKLSFGIAKIAAAFFPNTVIVRFSDFKTNEYSNLTGGEHFEPMEENPMIGWRGASSIILIRIVKRSVLNVKRFITSGKKWASLMLPS
jgi:pyruvate,water dikinase